MAKKKEKTKKKFSVKKLLRDIAVLIIGNGAYAVAVVFFAEPAGLVLGGMTGVGITVNRLVPAIGVSYAVLALNVILLVLGAFLLGRRFFLTTVASSFIYPVLLEVCQQVSARVPQIREYLGEIYGDCLLCALAAGVLMGFGVGIVVRIGASTGGSDVPPLIFNKFFGLPVGAGMIILDGVIVASQIPFSNITQIAYGLLVIVGMSLVIDRTVIMGKGMVQIKVVSDRADEIRKEILTASKRGGGGVTLLSAKKGYSGEENEIVMSVVYSRELVYYKRLILAVDPQAFIIITRVSEVNGNGFSFSKNDKPIDKSDLE